MQLEGNSSAEISVAFLQQLRAQHPEPLIVIWDNDPAHGRAPLRAYFDQPGSAAPPGPLAGLQPRLQFGRRETKLTQGRWKISHTVLGISSLRTPVIRSSAAGCQ
jgi:hypothetical protein